MNLDLNLFQFIHSFAGRSKILDEFGIFFANYLPYLLVLAALYFIFRENTWKNKLMMFAVTTLNLILSRGILTETIRFFWPRQRPFDALGFQALIPESGASFPSGHAAFYFALAAVIFYFNKKWGIWFLILSFLNGLARVFVGVHWPGDILGGIVVGLLSFWLVKLLIKKYLISKPQEEKTPD